MYIDTSPTKESDMNDDLLRELQDLPDALLDGLFDDEPAEESQT